MKKSFYLILLGIVVSLGIVGAFQLRSLPKKLIKQTPSSGNVMTGNLSSEAIFSGSNFTTGSKYTFTWTMNNPGLSGITNLDMMIKGYKEIKKIDHIITQEDMNMIQDENCKKYPLQIFAEGLGEIGTLNTKGLKVGSKTFITIPYQGSGLGLNFSKNQYTQLNKNGWIIIEPNDTMLKKLQGAINYDPTTQEPYNPEWSYYYDTIGGNNSPQKRYPYNTIYVSSDLLLHAYHKLFENTLKEYEVNTARKLLSQTIDESLTTFSALNKNNKDSALKPYYDYLVAYRSVAKILLVDQNEISTIISNSRQQQNTGVENGELTDDYLYTIILKRLTLITKQYPTQYTPAIQSSIKSILSGMESKQIDFLSQAFSPQTDPNFIIKQDYTQFVPRSHYTENSYLKTYFLAMKWLMRHKMYTRDQKSLQAALILEHNLPKKASNNMKVLQDFVHKMIGADDDINLNDLEQFIQGKELTSDKDIITTYKPSRTTEINVLRPQKIISTTYTTPENGSTTETQAKDQTAGFVFFGEKFTTDAWITDQLTAGPTEKEFQIKPSVVSIYEIRDTIMGGKRADYAIDWFHIYQSEFKFTQLQLDSYPKNRSQTQQQLSKYQDNTIYAQWIKLAQYASVLPTNAPSYMKQDTFIDKMYNTILGTYTELKHDTLLYVKQAFAELGMGGDMCGISIQVSALPVPKGYVEPQIDLIDQLLSLSQQTQTFFGSGNKENFTLFIDYLKFVKTIAIAETQNKKVSDSDFEKLRTSSNILQQVMSPAPTYQTSGERGMRSALIADIFTSGEYGPYYIATGRPLLMIVLVDDINGKRAVIGPVYSTYDFYGTPFPSSAGRYTDNDRRKSYDSLSDKNKIMTLPLQHIVIQ